MSHAAQCMVCTFARWRGRNVVACDAFEESAVPAEIATALASLTYRAAATGRCGSFARIYIGPDAYLADDAPRSGEA